MENGPVCARLVPRRALRPHRPASRRADTRPHERGTHTRCHTRHRTPRTPRHRRRIHHGLTMGSRRRSRQRPVHDAVHSTKLYDGIASITADALCVAACMLLLL